MNGAVIQIAQELVIYFVSAWGGVSCECMDCLLHLRDGDRLVQVVVVASAVRGRLSLCGFEISYVPHPQLFQDVVIRTRMVVEETLNCLLADCFALRGVKKMAFFSKERMPDSLITISDMLGRAGK